MTLHDRVCCVPCHFVAAAATRSSLCCYCFIGAAATASSPSSPMPRWRLRTPKGTDMVTPHRLIGHPLLKMCARNSHKDLIAHVLGWSSSDGARWPGASAAAEIPCRAPPQRALSPRDGCCVYYYFGFCVEGDAGSGLNLEDDGTNAIASRTSRAARGRTGGGGGSGCHHVRWDGGGAEAAQKEDGGGGLAREEPGS